MKTNLLIISSVATASLLLLNSCATQQTGVFRDDVYHSNTQAVEQAYQSPDYYYDGEEYANEDTGIFYEDEYSDADYYADEYADSEYARRFERFYHFSPGMTYYDPFYDHHYGYGAYNMFNPWGYGPRFGMGFSYRYGWGMGMGMGMGGYSPYYYDPFYSWGWSGYPYYGNNYWGPYSYNRWGYNPYGYGGGYYNGPGYYVGTPRTMTVRSSGRDGMNVRQAQSPTRTSNAAVVRSIEGRIATRNGENRTGISSIRDSRTGNTIRNGTRSGTRNEAVRPGVSSSRTGADGRIIRPTTTRPSSTRATRPTTTRQTRPTTTRPTTTRPTSTRPTTTRQTRPTTTRPTTTRPASTTRSTGSAVSSGSNTRSSSGSSGTTTTRSTGTRNR